MKKKANLSMVVLGLLLVGLVIAGLVLAMRSDNKQSSMSMRPMGRKVGNPGCDVNEQVACTQRTDCEGGNSKSGAVQCMACDDWEGEGCVPKNCACTACQTPPAGCPPQIDG